MNDQVFEFAANKLVRFRVTVADDAVVMQTVTTPGGKAVRTWKVAFEDVRSVVISDRIGRRTRSCGVNVMARVGSGVHFAWSKGPLGVNPDDGRTYHAAVEALMRRLAEKRPDLQVTMNAGARGPALIGLAIVPVAAVSFIVATTKTWTPVAWALIAVIVGLSLFSLPRSGILAKSRQLPSSVAAEEMAARRALV